MNNLLLYSGLVDPKISASDKDLPVAITPKSEVKKCPKVFNVSEFHFSEVTFFQNWYFSVIILFLLGNLADFRDYGRIWLIFLSINATLPLIFLNLYLTHKNKFLKDGALWYLKYVLFLRRRKCTFLKEKNFSSICVNHVSLVWALFTCCSVLLDRWTFLWPYFWSKIAKSPIEF